LVKNFKKIKLKKILILAGQRNENKDKFIEYLTEYFRDKNIEIDLDIFSNVSVLLNQNKVEMFVGDKDIRDFDLVYFRSTKGFQALAKTMATILDFLEIKYIDKVWGKAAAVGDKLTSFARLTTQKLPVIPTLFCNVSNKKKIQDFASEVNYPLIAKDLVAQRLEGIYVIHSINDINKLPEVKESGAIVNYLFQKFIDIKAEYRLVVLGDTVQVTHTKVARNYSGHKVHHLDENSTIEFLDSNIMDEVNKIAVNGAKALDLNIAGVDICIEKSTNKPWIIEVNRGPGIDYDTTFSPEMSEFAKYLEKIV